jgi:hypothetical protein
MLDPVRIPVAGNSAGRGSARQDPRDAVGRRVVRSRPLPAGSAGCVWYRDEAVSMRLAREAAEAKGARSSLTPPSLPMALAHSWRPALMTKALSMFIERAIVAHLLFDKNAMSMRHAHDRCVCACGQGRRNGSCARTATQYRRGGSQACYSHLRQRIGAIERHLDHRSAGWDSDVLEDVGPG